MLKANSKELLMRIFEKNYTIFFYKKIYTLFSDFTQGASRILRDRVLTHQSCSFFQDVMYCVFHLSKLDPPKKTNKQTNKQIVVHGNKGENSHLKYNLPRDCYSKDFCCLVVHYLFLFGVWTSVLTKIFIKRMKYLPTFWRNFIRFV